MQVESIILSAGKGTRMKTEAPKVVQKLLGYEMVNHVLSNLRQAGIKDHTLVVGYKKEEVLNAIDNFNYDYVEQKQQLGTGHAVKVCKSKFKNKNGITVIVCGDTPLVSSDTFKKLIKKHKQEKSAMTILTAKVENPTGYGRIIRNDIGSVTAIVEEKDATFTQRQIKEINSGIYCFDTKLLFKYIDKIKNNNKQKEYYLTDLVEIFNNNKQRVAAFVCEDSDEIKGINDLVALDQATSILQKRINTNLQLNGVKIIDQSSTFIGPKVKIGPGTVIEPNNIIYGECKIGANCTLKQGNTIDNSVIGTDTLVGPQAHIHTNSKIGNWCKIGNFVEVKNTTVKDHSKAAHLTYLGDSVIGKNVNIGCGVITANYDGVNKHKTIIKDNCFIGSNVTLIAPITIEKDCLIAAGSTVSLNKIPKDKLVIAREREVIKERKNRGRK